MNWLRVNRQNRCPVCTKDSWCMIVPGPNGNLVLCMRTTSNRPFTLKSGEVGYFHSFNGEPVHVKRAERPPPVINVGKLMEQWESETKLGMIEGLANSLGVSIQSLRNLSCAWAKEHRAWAFPMCDGYGNYTGIRLRSIEGHKWAVKGSHQGVFLPYITCSYRMALICEGPTDTAAAMTLGFWAVGRPSCAGGMHDILTAFKRLRVNRAVLIADNDDPGVRGAQMRIPSAMLVLPTKDLRDMVRLGGTTELLRSMIDQLIWKQPK